jgi:predicted DNA-binding protein with PD1-like motif
MKTLTCALALLAVGSMAVAQQSRTEVTNAVSVAEDSKMNNSTVPDVYTLSGQFSRIAVLRLKYDTDLLAGLEQGLKEEKIRNAVILTGIGSVRNYHFHVVSNRTFPSKNLFVKDPTAPADIVNINGYVIDGRVHAHVTMSDADKAFGGHLERGTSVFTFAIVTVGVFADGIDLSRVDDKSYR